MPELTQLLQNIVHLLRIQKRYFLLKIRVQSLNLRVKTRFLKLTVIFYTL